MLGIGRKQVIRPPCLPGREAVDPAALEGELAALGGRPAIVVASAGTVNTGDFDDLLALARIRERHPFWLHVDGAFGLFAACSPRFQHLVEGLAAADSITVDGHKWLNVPYDSALQLTRHLEAQLAVFQNASSYLARPEPLEHNFIHLVPENSRRFRALPAWMSLVAYGREGYRELVERGCDLARALGEKIAGAGPFELLAPVRLNTVCFALRDRQGGLASEEETRRFLTRLRDDGRAFLTYTVHDGQPAARCALTGWRTREEDVEITFQALLAAAEAG
jgi:glutamate/tyrosine decarboxylase-like PLP-dependent enzyme